MTTWNSAKYAAGCWGGAEEDVRSVAVVWCEKVSELNETWGGGSLH